MSKHTKTAKRDNQTASEEQAKVAGVLEGDSNTVPAADHGVPAGFNTGMTEGVLTGQDVIEGK